MALKIPRKNKQKSNKTNKQTNKQTNHFKTFDKISA